MILNVHAGHGVAGKGTVGAVGILNESVEDRRVKDEVIRLLRLLGHTVYDCTVDGGTASQILAAIVKKCNEHTVDLDVSIHFNAGHNDPNGDGITTGTEAFVYNNESTIAKKYAQRVVDSISTLGFRNRGVKVNPSLYVLRNTNAQAVLIECLFLDDKDDCELYDYAKMAGAIVYGLTGQRYVEPKADYDAEADQSGAETPVGDSDTIYRVQVGAYRNRANAKSLQKKLTDAGFISFVTKA